MKRGGALGRPSKLTPEVEQKLCQAIEIGNFYAAACAYSGVSYSAFRDWMKRGERAKSGPYRRLYDAVKLAEATSEVTLVAFWRRGAEKSWVAARALLERRVPDRWAAPRGPGQGGEAGGGSVTAVELSDAADEALSAAAVRAADEEKQAARIIVNRTYFGASVAPTLTGPCSTHTHSPPEGEPDSPPGVSKV